MLQSYTFQITAIPLRGQLFKTNQDLYSAIVIDHAENMTKL